MKLHHSAIILFSLLMTSCKAVNQKEINLIGLNFQFSPDTIIVNEGDEVIINFSNSDTVPHLISIEDYEVHIGLPPGNSFPLEFTADKIGSFEYYSDVPGHLEAGMIGTLIVEPSPLKYCDLPRNQTQNLLFYNS